MNMIRIEDQETTISFAPNRICKSAEVYTCMPNMLNRIRKLAETRPDCVKIQRDLGDYLFAEVDSSCIKIIPKRKFSEEQRAAVAERLSKGRVNNK